MIKLDNKKYIGEQITDKDIASWDKGDIVTIRAGTGSGKSYFIKNSLYKYAKENDMKILLLVHRLNCLSQFQEDIKGKEDVITLETYQFIDVKLEAGGSYNLSQYDFIISDEFHYFTSDASFNNKTDMSIEAILDSDSTRIFMSATANLMQRYLKGHKKLDTIDYYMESDFSFIDNLYFYNDDATEDSIISEIVKNDEKAMVFINDAKRLAEVYEQYKNVAMFNCASSRSEYNKYADKDKIKNMLRNQRFEDNLLLTTSVMDTGVSIRDREVKHIVCSNIRELDVLVQVLGRKRIEDETDTVNVYIKNLHGRQIGGEMRVLDKKLDRVKDLEELGIEGYTDKYKKETDYKEIVYPVKGEEGYKINKMAWFKVLYDSVELDKISKSGGYKEYISNALGMDYVDLDVVIRGQDLEEYLEGIVGKRLYKDEQEELIRQIDVRVNGRQQRSYNKLNEGLSMLGVNYIILPKRTSNNRYWVVEHIDR